MRNWNIEVYVLGQDGELLPATCFEKVTFKLHESFGKKATQSTSTPLFQTCFHRPFSRDLIIPQ